MEKRVKIPASEIDSGLHFMPAAMHVKGGQIISGILKPAGMQSPMGLRTSKLWWKLQEFLTSTFPSTATCSNSELHHDCW